MTNKNLREIMEYEPCPAIKKYYGRRVQPGSTCCMRCDNFVDREYVNRGNDAVYRIKCLYIKGVRK